MSQSATAILEEQFEELVIPEGKKLKVFKQLNAGQLTLLTSMSLVELSHHSDVANDRFPDDERSQRGLDPVHANKLAVYFLKSLLDAAISRMRKQGRNVSETFYQIQDQIGKQVYYSIAPIVANLRSGSIEHISQLIDKNNEVIGHQITLRVGDTLWIIDGQHRRRGIEIVLDFLKHVTANHKYPGRGSIFNGHKNKLTSEELEVWRECKDMCTFCKVALEIHIGLDIDAERQLFHDLNQLGKKIDVSLANKFDSSNPINNYASEVLMDDIFDGIYSVLDTSTEADWTDTKPSINRKALASINALLFLNKNNINGATPADVTEHKKEIANKFWSNVLEIPGFTEESPRIKTVAAQPVVLKAIAKLYYDIFFGKNSTLNNPENQKALEEGLKTFDFSHSNPAWRYYLVDETERVALGLSELKSYMPAEGDGSNRDMGIYDATTNTFRFGAKHNDIYPLIGDVIRWHSKLPTRQK
jgi:hypothetical protein